MGNVNVSVPYSIAQDEALKRIRNFVTEMKGQYAGSMQDFKESWEGNVGTFSGSGAGFSATGTVTVDPAVVTVNMEIPAFATLFRGRIEAGIREQLGKLLG